MTELPFSDAASSEIARGYNIKPRPQGWEAICKHCGRNWQFTKRPQWGKRPWLTQQTVFELLDHEHSHDPERRVTS